MTLFLWAMLFHWIADFILQSHWQATNKSSNWRALANHVWVYSFTMTFLISIVQYISILTIVAFWVITFALHFITDAITSRITSRLYAKHDFHNFFVVIGFDQMLHYFQLYFTLKGLGYVM